MTTKTRREALAILNQRYGSWEAPTDAERELLWDLRLETEDKGSKAFDMLQRSRPGSVRHHRLAEQVTELGDLHERLKALLDQTAPGRMQGRGAS